LRSSSTPLCFVLEWKRCLCGRSPLSASKNVGIQGRQPRSTNPPFLNEIIYFPENNSNSTRWNNRI
jgi:hypothetical protein